MTVETSQSEILTVVALQTIKISQLEAKIQNLVTMHNELVTEKGQLEALNKDLHQIIDELKSK